MCFLNDYVSFASLRQTYCVSLEERIFCKKEIVYDYRVSLRGVPSASEGACRSNLLRLPRFARNDDSSC
jgi:hypothetical protein